MIMKVKATELQVASILDDYKNGTHPDPRTGELLFGDLPIIFARAEMMANIYQELESLVGESAGAVLKRMGRRYGEKFHRLVTEERGDLLGNRELLLQFVCAETQAIGWGRITIEDDGKEVVITSRDGLASGRAIAGSSGRTAPVDSYFLGYFEGFLNTLDSTRYSSEEVECVAKGDKQCRMVFARDRGQ